MNNFNQNWNNQQNTQQSTPNNQNQPQTNFQQPNSQTQTNQPPSIMMKLMSSCLPVLLEQFTGQAMPPMGGNNAELQLALSQVISLQQQIITGQQNLDQRLTQLETKLLEAQSSASQQFTGLAQEVKSIKSIRLTHDRERKQIEFNGDGNFQPQQEN